ncbi:MAG: hypothetical protein EON98_08145 [Chitinophagaceae bacterium]|nr:MAG: hypothetical protein EON98_08145 [Chitinophagaceae bacterium]
MLVILNVSLFSCGESEFEADSRKMAKLMCKEIQVAVRAANGDATVKDELEKVRSERDKLKEELSLKYQTEIANEKMRKRAEEITSEELAKCK